MAHECPECGSVCHCCGDIDDIVLGESLACEHCKYCRRCDQCPCECDYDDDCRVDLKIKKPIKAKFTTPE